MCFLCKDYVYDDEMDEIAKAEQKLACRSLGAFDIIIINICIGFVHKISIILKTTTTTHQQKTTSTQLRHTTHHFSTQTKTTSTPTQQLLRTHIYNTNHTKNLFF